MAGKSKFQISRSLDERIKRIVNGTNEYDSEFSEVSSAYILGFNYGNVTNCVGLTKNYQLHHAVFPVVGLVFFKASPTDEDIKTSLKSIREFSSSPNGLGSFKSDKNEHLFLIYSADKETGEVDKRIFNFTKGTFVRRKRLRLNILNDPYCPRNVQGGSEELYNLGDGDSMSSSDDDQIDHLIFFIHGVGGVCDVRFRSCVEVVADFRKMANNLLAQQFSQQTPRTQSTSPSSGDETPSSKHLASSLKRGFFRKQSTESSHSSDATIDSTTKTSNSNKPRRVECLPISWHSLTRRQTGMNDQLNLIALSSVPKLRYFLNKVVMDALLYSSGPVYNQTIINNVGNEINRLYTLFMEKHPNFTGSISLAGHSLGSVICFDLLAHQIPQEPIQDGQAKPNSASAGSNESISMPKDGNRVNNNNINEGNSNLGDNFQNKQIPGSINHHVAAKQPGSCIDYKNLDELLKDMDMMKYSDLFHKEHLDLNSILLLTDLDMKELNLPLGVRRKLGTYINLRKISLIPVDRGNTHQRQYTATSSENLGKPSKTPSDYNNHLFEDMNTGQYLVDFPQLKFKPRCFFAFGSPMPMFLNVRGIQNISKEYKLPTCDRMFNIFHPYDPLAYRFEPLIDPRFKNVEPVLLAHHRGGKRIHVQLREGFAKVGHDIKHKLLGSIRNTWSSFTRNPTASPETARSPSDSPVNPGEKTRCRLTKSASSSVDVEIESFESAINMLPNPKRRPLKRQPLVRSQSEVKPGNLKNLIDGSISPDADDEAIDGSDTDCPSPGDDLMRKMNSMALSESEVMGLKEALMQNQAALNPKKPGSSSTPEGNTAGGSSQQQEPTKKSDSMEFDSTKVGKLNGGRRIDYVLQEKPIELFNEYIFAFTSHANYWQNEDSALIILNEIYANEGIHMFDHVME